MEQSEDCCQGISQLVKASSILNAKLGRRTSSVYEEPSERVTSSSGAFHQEKAPTPMPTTIRQATKTIPTFCPRRRGWGGLAIVRSRSWAIWSGGPKAAV